MKVKKIDIGIIKQLKNQCICINRYVGVFCELDCKVYCGNEYCKIKNVIKIFYRGKYFA